MSIDKDLATSQFQQAVQKGRDKTLRKSIEAVIEKWDNRALAIFGEAALDTWCKLRADLKRAMKFSTDD